MEKAITGDVVAARGHSLGCFGRSGEKVASPRWGRLCEVPALFQQRYLPCGTDFLLPAAQPAGSAGATNKLSHPGIHSSRGGNDGQPYQRVQLGRRDFVTAFACTAPARLHFSHQSATNSCSSLARHGRRILYLDQCYLDDNSTLLLTRRSN